MPLYLLAFEHKPEDCPKSMEEGVRLGRKFPELNVQPTAEAFCGCPHGQHRGVMLVGSDDGRDVDAFVKANTVDRVQVTVVDRLCWPLEA